MTFESGSLIGRYVEADSMSRTDHPYISRTQSRQFMNRISKTVKHYVDPIEIAWRQTNPHVPMPIILRRGAGSVAERYL